MDRQTGLTETAALFKVLGNESRLWLVRLLSEESTTVGSLAQQTGMSQPLVSQHLRTLRQAGLVSAVRHGKEMTYEVADHHVSHVIDDALVHVLEPAAERSAAPDEKELS